MRCLSPILLYDTGKVTEKGKRCLTAKCNPRLPIERTPIPVPCGKCAACLNNRMQSWVSRLRLEAFSSDASTYITLTYANNPKTLFKEHVQRFIKRLRNAGRDFDFPMPHIRYIVTGEYGSKFGRPHWHGIIFGLDMMSPFWKPRLVLMKDGYPVYTSDLLRRIWNYGFVSLDKVTDNSIKYVAKYILKDGSVSLKSQGLGRSAFVRVSRHSRKFTYNLTELLYQTVDNGFLFLPSNRGFSPVGFPASFDRYIERCDKPLFDSVRDRRRDFASHVPVDFTFNGAQVARYYYNKNNKKGILDNET